METIARCIEESCPLSLVYVEGQWYHINPHDRVVDHDAIPNL